MARSFDDTYKHYLGRLATVVSGPPFTMACWFYGDDASVWGNLMSVTSLVAKDAHALDLTSAADGQHLAASSQEDDAWHRAETTGTWTANVWSHACGVWATGSSRYTYLDGADQGTNTDACNPGQLGRMNVGGIIYGFGDPGQSFSGRIAEAAIWSAALSNTEVGALAAGYCPLMVRPGDLAAYWPLGGVFGRCDLDRSKNGYDLIPYILPGWADHPPVIYPSRPLVVGRESAGSASPAADREYRAVAGQVWHTGAAAAQHDVPGPRAGQVFTPGQVVGNAHA